MTERLFPTNPRLPLIEDVEVVEQGGNSPPIVKCKGTGVGCWSIGWFKTAKICSSSRLPNQPEILLCGKQ